VYQNNRVSRPEFLVAGCARSHGDLRLKPFQSRRKTPILFHVCSLQNRGIQSPETRLRLLQWQRVCLRIGLSPLRAGRELLAPEERRARRLGRLLERRRPWAAMGPEAPGLWSVGARD